MKLSFKKLTEDDWRTTVSIEGAVSGGKTFKAYTEESEAREYLRGSEVFLVMLGKEPIGEASYRLKSSDHAYIDSMVILPEYQGKGYGSQSLEWLLDKLKGIKRVDLVTHPHNSKAIGVYLKHGFVIESWKDNYFGDGEPRIELVLVKTKKEKLTP